ncbi:MAG TPA: RNA polymerase sigma factor [Solirubrobacteraceae bacterium]|nr:RNA polymerase sigma factor [Solirubrobacteraceae bacterium]
MQRQRQLDPEALGDHIDRLYRAALALCGSPTDAEDLVQETFLNVLRRPRFLRGDDDIGYLLRVLRNTFISGARAARRRPATQPLPDTFELLADPHASDPLEHLESAALYGTIAALPPAFRDALIAVDVVGLSYQQAARALRVREATLTTRLHRARRRVARELGPEGSSVGDGRQGSSVGEHREAQA